MVVGGFAAIFYGEHRLTLDVDVVVDMQIRHIRPFVHLRVFHHQKGNQASDRILARSSC
jgi:hypothetical protein